VRRIVIALLLAACGGSPCYTVAGKNYRLTETVEDGGTCTLSSPTETLMFSSDGSAGTHRTWAQKGCAVTVQYRDPARDPVDYDLVMKNGELDGEMLLLTGPDGGASPNCIVSVTGLQSP
jgi:hypothetical protein